MYHRRVNQRRIDAAKGRITTVLGSAAAFALFARSPSAQQILKMATSWGGGLVMEKQAKHFAEQVEFLTNKEIKLEVFPGGALGTALKVSETVRNGVADLGHTCGGYDWGVNKATALLSGYVGGLAAERLVQQRVQERALGAGARPAADRGTGGGRCRLSGAARRSTTTRTGEGS